MSIKWTKSQENAICEEGKTLLVSAGAGAGKTAVLVERIIRAMTWHDAPADINRMLVMTFTNAAAEEMKEKIRHRLQKEIQENPENEHLRRQYLLIRRASISTIHAFCADVLRTYAHQLDIDPAYQVADEIKAKVLFDQALEEMMESQYESGDPAFLHLVNTFGVGRDDRILEEMVKDLHQYVKSTPDPAGWLRDKTAYFHTEGIHLDRTPWGKELREYAREVMTRLVKRVCDLQGDISLLAEFDEYANTLSQDLCLYQNTLQVLEEAEWDVCHEYFSRASFAKLGRISRDADPEIRDMVKSFREEMKESFRDVAGIFHAEAGEHLKHIRDLQPLVYMLGKMVLDLDERFSRKKKAMSILDFNDLEHYCLECLRGDAGRQLRERYVQVFVDEYQDSNLIQEEILKLVGREDNVFLVGDVKQSIYAFRNATPKLFKERYMTYPDIDKALPGEKRIKVELRENFRSRKEILNFVNHIFCEIMDGSGDNVRYDESVFLLEGNRIKENRHPYPLHTRIPEILLIPGDDEEEIDFDGHVKNMDKEAAAVGKKILELREKNPGLPYGDIVILLRTVAGWSRAFSIQLANMGIPYVCETEETFFDRGEIMFLVSMLRIVDNPLQDIPLAAVLRSSVFQFTDEELASIRGNSTKPYFFEALLDREKTSPHKEKILHFLSEYAYYIDYASHHPPYALLWEMATRTGFYYIGSDLNPDRVKQASIRKLFDLGVEYESSRLGGLFGFIRYLDGCADKKIDITPVVDPGQGQDAVRILTIHKSKGLEFPVVILAGCGKGFNMKDARARMLRDRELGFGPDWIDGEQGTYQHSCAKRAIVIRANRNIREEEMRLLYVAMTRAKECLILIGFRRNLKKSLVRWQQVSDASDASCYLDWVMPHALKLHLSGLVNIKEVPLHPLHEILSRVRDSEAVWDDSDKKTASAPYAVSSWEYPWKEEIRRKRRMAVTEVQKLLERGIFDEEWQIAAGLVEKPAFLTRKDPLDPLTRGTKIHRVFAEVNLIKARDEEHIRSLCRKAGLEEQDVPQVFGFFNTILGDRLLRSSQVFREKPFLMPFTAIREFLPAGAIAGVGDGTRIQGVIDCLFLEDGKGIIVDFKTDYLLPGHEEEKARGYQIQMDLYGRAVEYFLKIPVKETWIYFTRTGGLAALF